MIFFFYNIKPLFFSVSLLACEAEIEEIGAIIIKEDLEGGNCLGDLMFKNIIFERVGIKSVICGYDA